MGNSDERIKRVLMFDGPAPPGGGLPFWLFQTKLDYLFRGCFEPEIDF